MNPSVHCQGVRVRVNDINSRENGDPDQRQPVLLSAECLRRDLT